PTYQLFGSKETYAGGGRPYILRPMFTTEGHVADVLRWVNGRLSKCRLEHVGTSPVNPDGSFNFNASAVYSTGQRSQPLAIRADFDNPVDQEARRILGMIPDQLFSGCQKAAY